MTWGRGVKYYDEGLQSLIVWLDAEAFKHNYRKLHKVLHFLQDARRPVYSIDGLWNLLYNPVPNALRAKDSLPKNVPPEQMKSEEEEPLGEPLELDARADESQFSQKTTQQKLNRSLDELV